MGSQLHFRRERRKPYNHNHRNLFYPSESDKRWAETVHKKYPNAVLKIYFKNSYYEYDEKGLLTIPETNTMKDIEVFDNYIKP